jgi:predicted enzyme related to lactoylglutathione lyase
MKNIFKIIIISILLYSCQSETKEKEINMSNNEPKVVGVGGVFFKTKNTKKTQKWYQKNLGIVPTDTWGTVFQSRDIDNPDQMNSFVWSPHDQKTDYFDPSKKEFMINYRVQNIEDFVKVLKEKGITILLEVTEYEGLGKFSHILDPEGNKIELWEPPIDTKSIEK